MTEGEVGESLVPEHVPQVEFGPGDTEPVPVVARRGEGLQSRIDGEQLGAVRPRDHIPLIPIQGVGGGIETVIVHETAEDAVGSFGGPPVLAVIVLPVPALRRDEGDPGPPLEQIAAVLRQRGGGGRQHATGAEDGDGSEDGALRIGKGRHGDSIQVFRCSRAPPTSRVGRRHPQLRWR